jgi:hypothetical protein
MIRKRCPNGTRRNKRTGECEKFTRRNRLNPPADLPKDKSPSTTKEPANKELDQPLVVPSAAVSAVMEGQPATSTSTSSSTSSAMSTSKTPRTLYARAQFKDKPIYLLDKARELSVPGSIDPSILFQISISGPEQFTNYVNLSKKGDKPLIDCFFQSLFTLGLREVSLAKKDAKKINKRGKDGVLFTEGAEYLASTFGIPKELVKYVSVPFSSYNNKHATTSINQFMTNHLENNHATILTLQFDKYGKRVFSHYMVVYKYKNKIFYFDAQNKMDVPDNKILSKTLAHIIKYTGNTFITRFGYYSVSGLDDPIQMINVSCPIQYVG